MTDTETMNPPSLNLTRRTMLQSLALTTIPLAGAMLAPASAQSEMDTAAIDILIDAHREAWQYFEDHCSDLDELETLYRQEHQRPLTPIAVAPDGRPMREYLEVDVRYVDQSAEEIKKKHAQLRATFCGPLARGFASAAAEALEIALRSSQRRSLLRLRATVREELKQQEAYGIAAAQAAYDEMSGAEDHTLRAVLSYVPANPAEAKRKADHISWYRKRGNNLTDDQLDALMTSVAGASNAA